MSPTRSVMQAIDNMTANPRTVPVRNGVRQVRVDAEHAGRRVDNFLSTLLRDVPKSRIYRMLRKGEVRVNGGRVGPDHRLEADDLVRIPPVRQQPAGGRPAVARPADWLAGRVIYEDARFLVVDKPSGMAVHGGSGVSFGVIETMRALRPELPEMELVHRLDRDTSGCLMIAKKPSALRRLHALLRQGAIGKRYLTLVKGRWRGGVRTIDQPLRKNVLRGGERVVHVHPEGKEAVSRFHPREQLKTACLMEVELETGRTHQIRVHAAHAGHPIAGDEKYGDAEFNKTLRGAGLRRLFLHAAALSIPLEEEAGVLTVSAPLPAELEQVVEHLRHGH